MKTFTRAVLLALPISTAALADAPKWQVNYDIGGEIFPAVVLSTIDMPRANNMTDKLAEHGGYNGALSIKVTSPKAGTKAKVIVQKNDFVKSETETTLELKESGKEYEIGPNIDWDFEKLTKLRQPTSATFTFKFQLDDGPTDSKTSYARFRSVNDVPFYYKDDKGAGHDAKFLFGAFVNENNPLIARILKEIAALPVKLPTMPGLGYQRGPGGVTEQIAMIWYYLQRKKITYTSITTPSGVSDRVHSQHVRFLEESFEDTQANCVDGTVLFASILRKIGIDPVLVNIPGHMYLGYYMQAGQNVKDLVFLETTMLGAQNPFFQTDATKFKDKMAKIFHHDNNLEISKGLFNRAVTAGISEFQKDAAKFGKIPGYQLIDVEKIRKIGVTPINR